MWRVFFLHLHSACFLFLFLALMYWIELPALCQIRVTNVNIFALFPESRGNIQSFTINYVDSCRFLWGSLSDWGSVPLFLSFWVYLIIYRFLKFFCILWFFFFSLFMWCFILVALWILNKLWKKTHLSTVIVSFLKIIQLL